MRACRPRTSTSTSGPSPSSRRSRGAGDCPASAPGRSSSRGSRPSALPPGAGDADARAAGLRADGIERALLALSSPLGIEALGPGEARPLLDAWHEAVLGLGPAFGAWGALALGDAGPADVDALLDRGAVGVSLPAGALASPERLESRGPVLEALERRDAPLLVHPGPGPGTPGGPPRRATRPRGGRPSPATSPSCRRRGWPGRAGAARPTRACAWSSPTWPGSRRCTPSAWPPAAGRRARCTTRSSSTTRRPTATAPSTRWCASSGSTPLVHGTDRPVVAAPPHHGLGAGGRRTR